MNKSLIEKFNMVLKDNENAQSEQNQRQIISDVLIYLDQKDDIPFEFSNGLSKHDMVNACLQKLRKINNISHSKKTFCKMYSLELDRLLGEICLCSNILLSDLGININLSAEPLTAVCSPFLIIDAFLNLISNAVKFGTDKSVNVSLKNTNRQICINVTQSFALLEPFNFKNGLNSVSNICRLHEGRLLFSHRLDKLTASISISKYLSSKESFTPLLFSQYLSDKYSAVYVGLSEFNTEN